jgi:hypothetical protein
MKVNLVSEIAIKKNKTWVKPATMSSDSTTRLVLDCPPSANMELMVGGKLFDSEIFMNPPILLPHAIPPSLG